MNHLSDNQKDAYARDTGHNYRSPFYSLETWEDKADRLRKEQKEKDGDRVREKDRGVP